MNKKGLISIGTGIIISIILVAAVIRPQVNRQALQNEEKTVALESGEVINKPTFMYFVTNSDLADKETKESIDRLQKDCGDKVIFEIKNVDADKKLLEDFSVIKDNTPALIMLKSDGDISNILFKTKEYDKLKAAIDGAF